MTRETYDILNNIFNGQTPLKRTNPKAGESEYYYFVPGQDDWTLLSEVKTVDVPSADTANPYLQSQTNSFGKPSQLAQNSTQTNDLNCYIEFDGKNFGIYKNGSLVNNLDGMSGQPDYQNRASQSIPNKGPIPEGTYYADQNQRQNISLSDAGIGTAVGMLNNIGIPINKGTWKGGPAAWGLRRVWLRPDENTNTYGRDGFSIHGGWSKGSAGCIDIPRQTKQLSDFLDNCQDSVPVYVKYPKESW